MSEIILKIKFLNWGWGTNNPNGKNDFFRKFIENYLMIKTKIVQEDPDILFFSVFKKRMSVKEYCKNNPNIKIKIFFTGENTMCKRSSGKGANHYFLDFADLSLGFKYLDHPKYIRFPLWLTYINIDKFNMGKKCLPYNNLVNFKKNFNKEYCCIVVNHDKNNTRTNILEHLSKYKKIYITTVLHEYKNKNIDYTILKTKNGGENGKQNYLNKFKFHVCSESSINKGYVTEKLFECIIGGCIPIYYCHDNQLIEPDILNNDFIIKYNDDNYQEALDKIKLLDSDEEAYNTFTNQLPLNSNSYDNIIKKYDELKDRIFYLLKIHDN